MTPDPERLRTLLARVAIGLRHEIANHLAAHPRAASYDSDRTTGGGGSDPTVSAALARDPARHDLEAHDAAVDRAYAALLTLVGLSEKYLPGHMPRRGDIQADTRTCHLHDQAGVIGAHKAKHRTDLGSFLPHPLRDPIDCCEPCYNFARNNGRVPTRDELIRHDRTGKWLARTTGKRGVFTAEGIAAEWNTRPEEAA